MKAKIEHCFACLTETDSSSVDNHNDAFEWHYHKWPKISRHLENYLTLDPTFDTTDCPWYSMDFEGPYKFYWSDE